MQTTYQVVSQEPGLSGSGSSGALCYLPGPVSEHHRTNRTQTLTQTLTLGRNPNLVSPV